MAPASDRVVVELSQVDAQRLYDHTGTMPYAPGSWSNNVRAVLSQALHEARTGASGGGEER